MYEIVMSNGDRAECDSIAACLVTAKTLYDDAEGGVRVTVVSFATSEPTPRLKASIREILNLHLMESANLI